MFGVHQHWTGRPGPCPGDHLAGCTHGGLLIPSQCSGTWASAGDQPGLTSNHHEAAAGLGLPRASWRPPLRMEGPAASHGSWWQQNCHCAVEVQEGVVMEGLFSCQEHARWARNWTCWKRSAWVQQCPLAWGFYCCPRGLWKGRWRASPPGPEGPPPRAQLCGGCSLLRRPQPWAGCGPGCQSWWKTIHKPNHAGWGHPGG